MNRVDNDPPSKDSATVIEVGQRPVVSNAQFGHLVRLLLDARTPSP